MRLQNWFLQSAIEFPMLNNLINFIDLETQARVAAFWRHAPTNVLGTTQKPWYLMRTVAPTTLKKFYVTDGSSMPTGGSVPCTWTIYANAFRVAEKIKDVLS